MADLPVDSLGGLTPLAYVPTPNMDMCARKGISGVVRTVPDGMAPGSDTANLSVFGYNPALYYTGRAPFEALNMGISLGSDDLAFRMNIINASGGVMNDFTSDHIASEYSAMIVESLRAIESPLEFHAGVSYRNIAVWRNYPYSSLPVCVPPHDIQTKVVAPYLPRGEGSDVLLNVMRRSSAVIADLQTRSPINLAGDPESVWLWGCGKRPALTPFKERFGITGVTISAVDLIHGIGVAAGLTPLKVKGATGYLDTDYGAKVRAALEALNEHDFVYLHVEAPDESGHEGNLEHKTRAIADFDAKVVAPVLDGLGDTPATILILPDHPTPLSVRTHTSDPVPFVIYAHNCELPDLKAAPVDAYSERAAAASGLYVDNGWDLLSLLIRKE